MTLTTKSKKHYAGHTPTATLGVSKVYADGLEYTEGGRRRISNAVTAGNFGATCLQPTPTAWSTPTVAVGVWPPTPTATLRRRSPSRAILEAAYADGTDI
jgi:hypothetical protein